jgi:hypothetical protein
MIVDRCGLIAFRDNGVRHRNATRLLEIAERLKV